jgi:hypothetical protein
VDAEDLVALYLSAQFAAGRTPATISWHRASLNQFLTWLRAEGHPSNPKD